MRRRHVAILAIGSCAAACSLTTDFNGLTNGAATMPGPGDAFADVTLGDAAATTDALFFAPDADAASTRACATPHTFCDDFDRSETLDPQWSPSLAGSPAGELGLVTSRALSAPRSARMTLASDYARTMLEWVPKELKATSVRVAFDVYLEQVPKSVKIASLGLSSASALSYVHLYFAEGKTFVFESQYRGFTDGGESFEQTPNESPYNPPTGTWLHIEMDYAPTLSLRIGPVGEPGTVLFDARPLRYATSVSAPSVELGLGDNEGTTTVYFDEVAIDTK